MSRRRNQAGYIDTADCFRTINGKRYVGWLTNASDERIAAYRAAGIKCRRINGSELFVWEADTTAARVIDRVMEKAVRA